MLKIEGIWQSLPNEIGSYERVYVTTKTTIRQWQQNHLTDPLFTEYFIPSAADPLDRFVLYRDFFSWNEKLNLWSFIDNHRNTLYMIFNE